MISLVLMAVVCLSGCAQAASIQDNTELHVIGVYEGTVPEPEAKPFWSQCGAGKDCPEETKARRVAVGGEVTVNVYITDRPVILALTAYDKTRWRIIGRAGVTIKKVILGGYHAQSVIGISEQIPAEVYTHDSSPCSHCYQGQGSFYSYEAPPGELQKITGLKPASFQGKYTGKEFNLFPELTQGESHASSR